MKFCVQQLDKFSAIHTKLTLIQKELVKEYLQQLGETLERELDDELTRRLHRLKAEKRHLQGVFDLGSVPSATPPSVPVTSAPHSSRFAYALNEVYKMSPTSLEERTKLGVLPKDGLIFAPLPLETTVKMFLKQDKFATFSCSFTALSKERRHLRVPCMYIGAGQLDDPSDLCAIPDKDLLVVSCIFKGLYCFNMSTAELLRVSRPPSSGDDQFVCVAYEAKHRLYLVSVLRHFCDWYIQMYDQRLQLRQEIPCPKDPKVSNSWYRWLTPLKNGRVLMCCGDEKVSSIWLLDLNANRWRQLIVKPDAAFRRAAFNPSRSGSGGLIYVPDMQRSSIMTYELDTETWELTNEREIDTAEFREELPGCVEISRGGLIVGNLRSGNIIVADLNKCSSQLLTSVGPDELFSFHAVKDKLAVLCKKKEVIEVYQLNLSTN